MHQAYFSIETDDYALQPMATKQVTYEVLSNDPSPNTLCRLPSTFDEPEVLNPLLIATDKGALTGYLHPSSDPL